MAATGAQNARACLAIPHGEETLLQNHRYKDRDLVCTDCYERERGIHQTDLKTYTCQNCNIKFSAKTFLKVQLSNY